MIFELSIKDFILIRDVKLRFDEGLNILTGETGAGKSMVLGAIGMVMGGQANKDSIRLGAEKASIQATFQVKENTNKLLKEQDIPTDEEILIVSREIQSKGKSISRINGQIVTLNQLKRITNELINIHGQNEHQSLLENDHQLNLLDAFGGDEQVALRDLVAAEYEKMRILKNELDQLEKKSHDRIKSLDFINYQITEIEDAKLKDDEDLELEKEFEYLTHLGQIKDTVSMASNWISGEYGEGAIGTLGQLNGQFRKIETYDTSIKDISNRINELFFIMEDLAKDIDHFSEKLDVDPEKFSIIEKRLDVINTLKSKYGMQISDIINKLASLMAEREEFEAIGELLEAKKLVLEKAIQKYQEFAEQLSNMRRKAALRFESALEAELKELNMKETTFKMDLTSSKTQHITGIDEIEFVISTNIGQPFRPLKKVVSGGELSRIMLGIKIVLGKLDEVPTLVFDEVDAGISGITANIVGEKLSKLAENCQILCITHLPQIAVYADHHFLIEKSSDGISTETELKKINDKEIEDEIGRLVGGASVTASTTQHAKEMIRIAGEKKYILRH
ncbi:DNA repair protein RecN [Fusibacter bizertensis]|uniref:DNA repair protein RecN n=1 Tax=Fusibacter bizertensis TaxID=1488331 RepID=A0ABT6N9I5_9FIRM|nr:DNA repair protein RecN [Fusibacter bizertensis]MDH8677071.1 DNA repair protein RecN [Fusibacter bizertensis]